MWRRLEAAGVAWASLWPHFPALAHQQACFIVLCRMYFACNWSPGINTCISACSIAHKVSFNYINQGSLNIRETPGQIEAGSLSKESLPNYTETVMRSNWQQSASPTKQRTPSSVTGGLEETQGTLKIPMLEGGLDWVGWTQAFSSRQCSPLGTKACIGFSMVLYKIQLPILRPSPSD